MKPLLSLFTLMLLVAFATDANPARSNGTKALKGSNKYKKIKKLNSQYQMVWWSMAAGGVLGSRSHNYQHSASVGQIAIQQLEGTSHKIFSGFWNFQQLITAVEEDQEEILVPKSYQLRQNYPNPFNLATTIQYALPKTGFVSLVIYNLLGQRVRVLVDDIQSIGYKTVTWNGRNESGEEMSSGVYLFKIVIKAISNGRAPGGTVFTQTKKMLLIK